MATDAAFALELAVVAALAVLIVAIVVVASSGACDREPASAAAAVDDVERALGADTLLTYDQAAKAALINRDGRKTSAPEGKEEEAPPSCAIYQSEYAAGGDERVRVVPACGHFFHTGCGIDWWLRTRGTCPYCRAELLRPPLPMPPRAGGATVGPP